jgi:hypothetical protein
MSKFEGNYPAKLKTAPEWWSEFSKNYQFVIKFLLSIGKNGIVFSQNQKFYSETRTVSSGEQITLSHNLGFVPSVVQIQGGRLKYFIINEKSDRSVKLTVSLLSEPILDTDSYDNIRSAAVGNPYIFNDGDSVSVESNGYKALTSVQRKEGFRIYFTSGVRVVLPAVLRLERETIEITLY